MPFFVSATAGTTVYGAFDPLIAIADICKKHDIWMHVDVSRSASLNLHELPEHFTCEILTVDGSPRVISVLAQPKYNSLDAELRIFLIVLHYCL